jgi:hypothetical protein
VVGDFIESIREAAKVLAGKGAAHSGDSLGGSFLKYLSQGCGAGEELSGVFVKWIDPVFFGLFIVDVKFAFVASEAFAES